MEGIHAETEDNYQEMGTFDKDNGNGKLDHLLNEFIKENILE